MILKQQAPAKFSTRKYNRCKICGRPHAYLRNYGICRICFRELGLQGSGSPASARPKLLISRDTIQRKISALERAHIEMFSYGGEPIPPACE